MIIIREVQDSEKDLFDRVVKHPVQSWEWGEFRKEMGNKVIRLGKFEGEKLLEGYTITLHKIPKTKYSLGMLTQCTTPSQEILNALKDLAKHENLVFIRIEPRIAISDEQQVISILQKNGCQKGRPFFNKSTYWIDLTKSEDELLKIMHPKTRYNIRVAEKHGVEIVENNSNQAFEKYLDLMDETTKRQGYFAHTEKYHRKMWEIFKPYGVAHLLTAQYQGKILASWILFVWQDTLYYPYGASSTLHKEVMAGTLMMWEAIKFGKQMGLKTFDLWGADEKGGYARFKESFGPEKIEFIGTWDLICNKPMYHAYRLAEELRWKLLKAKARLFPSISSFQRTNHG